MLLVLTFAKSFDRDGVWPEEKNELLNFGRRLLQVSHKNMVQMFRLVHCIAQVIIVCILNKPRRHKNRTVALCDLLSQLWNRRGMGILWAQDQ